jgi:hypothetical protein
MMERGESRITNPEEGEKALAEWEAQGVYVRQLPDDQQGILRISIGGGKTPAGDMAYCVFRGNRHECIALLRKALRALEKVPA